MPRIWNLQRVNSGLDRIEALLTQVLAKGQDRPEKNQINGARSSHASPRFEQQPGGIISEGSHQSWHDVVSLRKESNNRELIHLGSTHHELDCHVWLDVLDFFGDQNPDVFLDWKHKLEAFFKWHDVPEDHILQVVEAKLKGTTKIWWETYKKSYSKLGHGDVTKWSEMKAAMKKIFVPQDYKQGAHIQLNQLKQENLSMEEYTSQFQHLATRAGFKWNDEILVAMYRQGLHPQISMDLSFHQYPTLGDTIQVVYQIYENMKNLYYKKPFYGEYF